MSRAGNRDTPSRSALAAIAGVVVRRPRTVLAVWIVVVLALAIEGRGVENRLGSPETAVPGSPSKAALDFKKEAFGDQDFVVVMLRGPQREVERQGKLLTRRFDRAPGTTVVSPWAGGEAIEGLRPNPRVATILPSVQRKPGEQFMDVVPPVQRVLDQTVRPPVRAHVSGTPSITKAAHDEALEAAKTAEKIAFPVLAIVLLLVFGSPVAAMIPGIIGGTTVVASHGVISLLSGAIDFDSLATGTAAMMGLALGVDYSLLVVSRFREQRREGSDVPEAVDWAVRTTGRSVLFAGAALLLAMLVALQILPSSVVLSLAAAIVIASAFSMFAAIFVVPAMLVAAGSHLERFSIYRRGGGSGGVAAGFSRRFSTRRPALAALVILGALLLGTAHAFALDSAPPNVGMLPPDDRAREDYETVSRVLGPGWGGGFEVLVDGGSQPVTSRKRLEAMARFQDRVRRDPGIATIAGPAPIERSTRPLATLDKQLADAGRQADEGRRGLERLSGGLGQARNGAKEMQAGLTAAASGATLLAGGTDQARIGGRLLADGLRAAASGSDLLLDGLSLAREGGQRLADGSGQAHAGAGELRDGIGTARDGATELPAGARELRDGLRDGAGQLGELREPVGVATDELADAWDALQAMTVGRADPQYLEALESVGRARGAVTGRDPITGLQVDPRYEGLDAALVQAQEQAGVAADGANRLATGGDELVDGLARLESGAQELESGLATLADGNRRLADALGQLEGGGARLAPGIDLLAHETERLAGGLGQLDQGAGQLAAGLASGARRSGELPDGLGLLKEGVDEQRGQIPGGDPRELQRQSPGLFDSGYFYLASVDGTRGGGRKRARLVVSLDTGGHAARMSIIPTTGPLDDKTKDTRERLEGYAKGLEDETGMDVMVGGDQPGLWDYADDTRGAIPLATLGLALVTLLVLVPVLRSLLLPLVAVLLNVITVGATFGLLALLFDGGLLGGPGYMDVVSVGSIVTVLFGLAIDYEVFVLARMREEYLRTGSTEQAIERGLDGTARVVTGAAVIMIAVFMAFATSGFFAIRVFGTGLAIGVFLDAFVIRMIALPAIMRLLGDRCWWMPRWLDRMLPRVDIEGAREPRGAAPATS